MNATRRTRAQMFPFFILLGLMAWPTATPAQTGAPLGRWVSLGPTKILDGWSGVSNGDVTGRVTTIAIDFEDPNVIYAGARGSGVWRTRDGGMRWEPVTDDLPTQTVSALATAPSRSGRVYLATPKGTFRSEDSGSTWNHVSAVDLQPRGWDGGAMLVDPTDADRVFLTSCGGNGNTIFRSVDGGENWQSVLAAGCATGLVRDPADANRLLTAVSIDQNRTGLYETLDGGATWHRRPGCDGAALPPPASNTTIKIAQSGDVRFASYYGGGSYQLFRAPGKTCGSGEDADFLWEPAWTAPPGHGANPWSALHADPADPNRLAVTGINLYVSTDGGFNFSNPDPQPHVDHHAWAYDPRDSRVVFAGTDGGLYRSVDSGLPGTWTFIGEGIVNAELYDLADAATSPRLLFGGSQDNGAFEYPGTGTVWRWKWEGDAEMVEIDPTDARVRYTASQDLRQLAVTTDAYATAPVAIGAGPIFCPPWSGEYPADPMFHFLIHPADPAKLLVACGPLWIGRPWNALFTPTAGTVRTIAVDASVSLFWAGTQFGQIMAGPGGTDWRQLFPHPTGAPSVALELYPPDPTVMFAAFGPGANDSGRIYRLQRFDAAPTMVSAADITANLPAGIRVKSLAVDRLMPHTIYAGTDFGVYQGRSADGGATWFWVPYKNGMAEAVDVRALEVHPVTGVLRAGTFGRGVYEVQPDWPIGSLAAAEGRVTLLRVQDVGQLYGAPGDVIDADVIVRIDSRPEYAFGFQLRLDTQGPARRGMLNRLRDAFNRNAIVHLEYVRTGFRNGMLQRVWILP
jgi:photosystem II stability/assembly factor-like uncharacterized protein